MHSVLIPCRMALAVSVEQTDCGYLAWLQGGGNPGVEGGAIERAEETVGGGI